MPFHLFNRIEGITEGNAIKNNDFSFSDSVQNFNKN